ncbi:glycosyltransferase [uncultured Thiodictyon sp.]|uniref:glycosyltransferase n=1 Tax=uncultured Thiodictyon sp. TaxID=1846217 RepID=UPI0025DA6157|nr:glycosyltransferase [uncultured Thiodictyon sp.]
MPATIPSAASGCAPSRPRVLVCAYACHPTRGSEEAVGWNWVQALASFCEVTVITAVFHRDAIEACLRTTKAPWAAHVAFIYPAPRPWHYRPTPAWRRIEGSLLKPLMHFAYRSWLRAAARIAARLVAERHFDLTHQLTYVGFRFPGGLWRLSPPFVWGPIGGMEDTPWRLFGALGPVGMLYFGGRNLMNRLHRWLLRTPRQAALRAGPGLIAATSGIAGALQRCYGCPSTIVSEVTAPTLRAGILTRRAPDEPLRIAWSGEHAPGKALPLLLHALAGLPDSVAWRLTVFGSGSCTRRWHRLSRKLGLEACCRWRGQVPRQVMLTALDEAHLFVITSLKDLTSTVLVEALSRGVPVLCPDHCGFTDAVTPTCGIRLPIASPPTFVGALRASLLLLHADEARRRALAAGARRRAHDFSIEAKALALEAIYTRVRGPAHR